MSIFIKLLITFFSDIMKSSDFTEECGFTGAYTYDPDHPTGEKELYLMYDFEFRSELSKDRAIRFESCKYLKRTYCKTINKKLYLIYVFYIDKGLEYLYENLVSLSPELKLKLITFWDKDYDLRWTLLNEDFIDLEKTTNVPLEDYRHDPYKEWCLKTTKGQSLNRDCPSFF